MQLIIFLAVAETGLAPLPTKPNNMGGPSAREALNASPAQERERQRIKKRSSHPYSCITHAGEHAARGS